MKMAQYDHPGQDGSMDLGFAPDPQRRTPDNSGQATGTVTLSQEQFDAMLSRIAGSQERDYADAMGSIVQAPVEQPTARNLVDLSQLPDPRADPDGFKSGLTDVLNQAGNQLLEATAQRTQQVQSASDVLNSTWELLKNNYSDVAEHTDLVELAATREMNSLRQRGIDPMIVMAQNPESFVDAVAGRAQVSINRIRGVAEDADGDSDRSTEILAGGSPRPGKPQPAAAKQSNLVDELKSIQREMGIY
jgi:hypothetical protein